MTPSELLELAGILEPDEDWHLFGETVAVAWPSENTTTLRFNPSLTGEDWQVKQAVDVLNKLAEGITSLSDTRAHLIIFAIRDKVITPSAKALIASRSKA